MVKFKGTMRKIDRNSLDFSEHVPVMLNEVLHAVSPRAGAIYVDGTFGRGGYTRALLEKEECRVIAFDQDPDAQEIAEKFKEEFGDRFDFVLSPFDQLKRQLEALSIFKIDGLVLDLGVSSPQIDCAQRGFSFVSEGPLDMRMSQQGMTAADVVNEFPQDEIARILWVYGEERKSRLIARKIVEYRQSKLFRTTLELSELIAKTFSGKPGKIHPATRSFQALRIFVNRELEQLESVLHASVDVLKTLGRLVVVSFHSLEDRLVKEFFKDMLEQEPNSSRYVPASNLKKRSLFFTCPEKLKKPSEEETATNPRSRSARLRWGVFHGEKEGLCA